MKAEIEFNISRDLAPPLHPPSRLTIRHCTVAQPCFLSLNIFILKHICLMEIGVLASTTHRMYLSGVQCGIWDQQCVSFKFFVTASTFLGRSADVKLYIVSCSKQLLSLLCYNNSRHL